MPEPQFQIREMARRCRVKPGTLRYYERAGLLAAPTRLASGYRVYTDADVRHVQFIRLLRELGFAVRELQLLVRAVVSGAARPEVRARLRAKRDSVADSITSLQRAHDVLDALQACRCKGDCTLVSQLLSEVPPPSPSTRSVR